MKFPSLIRTNYQLIVEAVATGLAAAAGLCWVTVSVVASFRPDHLTQPYWSAIHGLRTDTCGAVAFLVAGVSFAGSEYLRLKRRYKNDQRLAPIVYTKLHLAAPAAISETIMVLSIALIGYLSINAVTHPVTLGMQATHFAPWPTEGTLRVLALFASALSVAAFRFLHVVQTQSL